jgi:hypothetical protein
LVAITIFVFVARVWLWPLFFYLSFKSSYVFHWRSHPRVLISTHRKVDLGSKGYQVAMHLFLFYTKHCFDSLVAKYVIPTKFELASIEIFCTVYGM